MELFIINRKYVQMLFVLFLMFILNQAVVHGANLVNANDVMSRLKIGVASNHQISFTSSSGISDGVISIDFSEVVQNTNNIDFNSIDLLYGIAGLEAQYALTANSGNALWGASMNSQTKILSLTYPSSNGVPIAPGDHVIVRVGTNTIYQINGSRQLINRDVVGSHIIDIATGNDTAKLAVALVVEDTAGVSASVALAPVTNFVARAIGATNVRLFWTDSLNGADGFRIERKVDGGSFALIATIPAGVQSYDDASVKQVTAYVYRVTAFVGAITSVPSAEIAVTTPGEGALILPPSSQPSKDSDTLPISNEAPIVSDRSTAQINDAQTAPSAAFALPETQNPASPAPAPNSAETLPPVTVFLGDKNAVRVNASETGSLSVQNIDTAHDAGGIDVALPPNAVATEYSLAVAPLSFGEAQVIDPQFRLMDAKETPDSVIYNVNVISNGETIRKFDRPLSITIRYNANLALSTKEETLRMYYWDASLKTWTLIESSQVNLVRKEVTAVVDHLTLFALFGDKKEGVPMRTVYVVPSTNIQDINSAPPTAATSEIAETPTENKSASSSTASGLFTFAFLLKLFALIYALILVARNIRILIKIRSRVPVGISNAKK